VSRASEDGPPEFRRDSIAPPVVRENLIYRPRGAREATCPLSRLALDPCETHPDTMDHASQGFGASDAEVEANESHDNRVSGLI